MRAHVFSLKRSETFDFLGDNNRRSVIIPFFDIPVHFDLSSDQYRVTVEAYYAHPLSIYYKSFSFDRDHLRSISASESFFRVLNSSGCTKRSQSSMRWISGSSTKILNDLRGQTSSVWSCDECDPIYIYEEDVRGCLDENGRLSDGLASHL